MIGAMYESTISYKKLDSLLEDEITNIRYSNNVNIIIDLKSIFKKAYRTNVDNIINDFHVNIEDVTSYIINMIGHYRNYLYKKGKYSTFYLLYSKSECKAIQKVYPNYKKDYYDKYFHAKDENKNLNNIIKASMNSIEVLSKYIPNVYYIDTSLVDEYAYCEYLIGSIIDKNDINLILSNDILFLQSLNNMSYMLDLKGNNTNMISQENAIEYLTEKPTSLKNVLPFILSISGINTYSINKIPTYGYKKALKEIEKLIDQKYLVDQKYLFFPKEELMKSEILKNNISLLKENFSIINFDPYFSVLKDKLLSKDVEKTIQESIQIKPKATLKQFKELNERVYLLFPLNLNFLLKGESIL